MMITWIEESSGTIGAPVCGDETLYRCWLFNVFDASGKLLYVEGSDLPVQQGTAWDCKWLCEYQPNDVEAKAKKLWSQFFSPSMAGKGPIVRAKVIRYNKYDVVPNWLCYTWDGVEGKLPKDCTIYGRSQQTGAVNVPQFTCPPGYTPVIENGVGRCVPANIPPLPITSPLRPVVPLPITSPLLLPIPTTLQPAPALIPRPPIQRVAGPPEKGFLGAAVEVATSGIIPAVLVLGILGLAFYGFGRLMQRGRLEENPERREPPVSRAPKRRASRRQRRRRGARKAARTRRRRRAVRRVRRRVRRALRS